MDRYLTEDSRYADVVFPSCTLFECPKAVPGTDGMTIQEPVIAPVGDAKNDVLILAGIAQKLGITENTVKNHIRHMMEKTGCGSRTELAIEARVSGVVVHLTE